MKGLSLWLPALAFAGSLLAHSPARSQEDGWARCRDESSTRQDDMVVAACSALLETRGLARDGRGDALFHRARAYSRLGDYRRAAPDFRESVRLGGRDPQLLNGLCWSLGVLGESLDEARRACDASLRAAPGDPRTLDSRALVALKQRRFQDAWDDYDAAFRAEPRGMSWLYGRGIAALRLGRTAEGRADIARAEAMYPGIAGMYEGYGIRP